MSSDVSIKRAMITKLIEEVDKLVGDSWDHSIEVEDYNKKFSKDALRIWAKFVVKYAQDLLESASALATVSMGECVFEDQVRIACALVTVKNIRDHWAMSSE